LKWRQSYGLVVDGDNAAGPGELEPHVAAGDFFDLPAAALDEFHERAGFANQVPLEEVAQRHEREVGQVNLGFCRADHPAIRRDKLLLRLFGEVKARFEPGVIKRVVDEDVGEAVGLAPEE
jgi:hypothetical protein